MISKRHVPSLDGVRGIAALAVFVFHYGGGARSSQPFVRFIGHAVRYGAAGVPLFFVLSGFLITGILWDSYRRRGWWTNFYARRSLRIFPLYYAVLALAVLASIALGDRWIQTRSFWPFLFYFQNMPFAGPIIGHAPIHIKLYHLWSLAVEEQFYLLWPFVLWPFRNRIRAAQSFCIAIWALSLAFRIWSGHKGISQWGVSVPAHAGELSMGSWLALSMRESDEIYRRILRFAPAAFLITLAAVCADSWVGWIHREEGLYPFPTTTMGLSIYALFFTSLIALCFRPGMVAKIFSFLPFRGAGKISYGIYVFHVALMPFYYWLLSPLVPRVSHNGFQVALFGVALTLTLSAAALSFHFFESRISRLKQRFPSESGVPALVGEDVVRPIPLPQTLAT